MLYLVLTGKQRTIHEFLREHVEREAERIGKTIEGITLIKDEEGNIFF